MFNCRLNQPKPGERYPVRECAPYALPAALAPGQMVTFIRFDQLTFDYLVRTDDGREFGLRFQAIDTGMSYEIQRGRWIHESHPLALDYIERQLSEARAKPGSSFEMERLRVAEIAACVRRLKRYGRIPDTETATADGKAER